MKQSSQEFPLLKRYFHFNKIFPVDIEFINLSMFENDFID